MDAIEISGKSSSQQIFYKKIQEKEYIFPKEHLYPNQFRSFLQENSCQFYDAKQKTTVCNIYPISLANDDLFDSALDFSCEDDSVSLLRNLFSDKTGNYFSCHLTDSIALYCKNASGGLKIKLQGEQEFSFHESLLLKDQPLGFLDTSYSGILLKKQDLFVLISKKTGQAELFHCSYDIEKQALSFYKRNERELIPFFSLSTSVSKMTGLIQIGEKIYYRKCQTEETYFLLKELYFGTDRSPHEIRLQTHSWKRGKPKTLITTRIGGIRFFMVSPTSYSGNTPVEVELFAEWDTQPIATLKFPLPQQEGNFSMIPSFVDFRTSLEETGLCVLWIRKRPTAASESCRWIQQVYDLGKIDRTYRERFYVEALRQKSLAELLRTTAVNDWASVD